MKRFLLKTEKKISKEQEKAVSSLVKGVKEGLKKQTLIGVTGSGKTFSVANVIARLGLPSLVILHNKTLAAQWYSDLKGMFPNNSVQFYISIFDFYRPESYIPRTSTYLEKESVINSEIQKLRSNALNSIVSKKDTIIVSSVSCIFGTGNPEGYKEVIIYLHVGEKISSQEIAGKLWKSSYKISEDINLNEGEFISTSNFVEISTLSFYDQKIKISINEGVINKIYVYDGKQWNSEKSVHIYPGTTHAVKESSWAKGIESIKKELKEWTEELIKENHIEEANRLIERTNNDIAFMKEHYTCNGIENYSVHFSGKKRGETPFSLLDFFPENFLTIVDESHQSIPQISAMHKSTKERIKKLVEFGYRLPSAHDNRPLTFEEFDDKLDKVIYVSATPSKYEIERSSNTVEQIIRPTGLLDPKIEIRSRDIQIEDCINDIKGHQGGKFLVITVTKRMSEKIDRHFRKLGIRSEYIHSELTSPERCRLINNLRSGETDVLVGINLLREGIDIPEVVSVYVLDADQEGFLRSKTSLLQICGRAARNSKGKVILYANKITESMRETIKESERRRELQISHNEKYGIVPTTTNRELEDVNKIPGYVETSSKSKREEISELTKEMKIAASEHRYKDAIDIRKKIQKLKPKRKK